MNPRECFQAAINHEEPDRVLVDFGKHIGSFHRIAYAQLKEHLSNLYFPGKIKILDRMAQNVVLDESICQRLGIDFRWVVPRWVGVQDFENDGQEGYIDMWGTPHIYTGDHYAISGQPLGRSDLTIADLDGYNWPDPDNLLMFEGLREQARDWYENTDYVIGADGIKVGILQTASQVRGYEQLFLDLGLNPHLADAIFDKILALIKAMYTAYMREVCEFVQVVCITDDQGTQNSLLISPQMFRHFIKPRLKELFAAIKQQADVKILFHCDGAVKPLLEDFIEIGVDILNPIQTVVKGFEDTRALNDEYGDRICWHGGIDVQQVMPNASTEELEQEVARRINDLGKGGGYIIAPCHNINSDIPIQNVLSMFDAAGKFGRYPLE